MAGWERVPQCEAVARRNEGLESFGPARGALERLVPYVVLISGAGTALQMQLRRSVRPLFLSRAISDAIFILYFHI